MVASVLRFLDLPLVYDTRSLRDPCGGLVVAEGEMREGQPVPTYGRSWAISGIYSSCAGTIGLSSFQKGSGIWNKASCLVGHGTYRAKIVHSAFTMGVGVVFLGIISFICTGGDRGSVSSQYSKAP